MAEMCTEDWRGGENVWIGDPCNYPRDQICDTYVQPGAPRVVTLVGAYLGYAFRVMRRHSVDFISLLSYEIVRVPLGERRLWGASKGGLFHEDRIRLFFCPA
jgi:hypothetical protein